MGLLKACLLRDGISCRVEHGDLRFRLALKRSEILLLLSIYRMSEWLFLPLAGLSAKKGREEYFGFLRRMGMSSALQAAVCEFLPRATEAARLAVEETVEAVLAHGSRIVGIVSQFEQNNATLAILRRLKEREPSLVTMVGGSNCMDQGGRAYLNFFPFVDYVFFGEADEIFSSVCRNILDEKDLPLPYGVLRRGDPLPECLPHRLTQDLDALPLPDFDDFFAVVKAHPEHFRRGEEEACLLLAEGSRGCWWGVKHPCTFCGLNGRVRTYREKSTPHFASELRLLLEKYGDHKIVFCDSILSRRHLRELPELLAENPPGKGILTEIKSNLKKSDLERLARVHINEIQPGIESLHDDILNIMHKGNTGIAHVALLKQARFCKVQIIWNLLYGFPDEPVEAYEEMLAFLPLIRHLEPPTAFRHIRYHRSSVYCNDPAAYGLELRPAEIYDYVAWDNEAYIADIAYEYDAIGERPLPAVYKEVEAVVNAWNARYASDYRERLDMQVFPDRVEIQDLRLCAKKTFDTLRGAARELYLAADDPQEKQGLVEMLEKSFGKAATEEALGFLLAVGLLLEMRGKILALAVESGK